MRQKQLTVRELVVLLSALSEDQKDLPLRTDWSMNQQVIGVELDERTKTVCIECSTDWV